MIRLVVADDHPIILLALEHLFEADREFEIAAYCRDGLETVQTVGRVRPDILLLDIGLPGADGLEVMRRLKAAGVEPRVVLLTAAIDEDQLLEAAQLGVDGLVLKETAPQTLLSCLRRVHAGERVLDAASTAQAFQKLLRREGAARELAGVLTDRETEIARLVAGGARNREIAERLHVSEGTIKVHLHHVYEKLRLRTRVELTIFARSKHLV